MRRLSTSTLLAATAGFALLWGGYAPDAGQEPPGAAFAQEAPDDDPDDDDDDDDDIGSDGAGDDDPGNDGIDDAGGDDVGGDDAGGDDVGGDDAGGDDAGGDDAGGDDGDDGLGGDDDGPGGDDDGPGGDGDGPGGDDDGPGGDDDGPGGDDDGPGGPAGGDDDDGPGGDDDGAPGTGGGRDDDDDDPPGGSGVRGVDADGGQRIRDGDRDIAGPSALPDGVEVDFEGYWVKAGEVLALEADPTSLEFARSLGFEVIERHRLTTLGLSIVELRVPRGQQTRAALETLQNGDPDTAYDFNHIYTAAQSARPAPAGARRPAASATPPPTPARVGAVGIVDTRIDAAHPSLRQTRIVQSDFVNRTIAPNDHGTAVASVIVGEAASRSTALSVYAAAVVDRSGARGAELASADRLVRALDWIAQNNVAVANVSLAGPPNRLVEDAVRRAQARGMLIVAAVGNDGPAAPPLYPAAYDGVVGVTAVDDNGVVYRRAGRGEHVDFAARGVGVQVAAPAGQSVEVSGTSYAAPSVAAALAELHTRMDSGSAAAAVATLKARARDVGDRGRDPVYGDGVVPTGRAQN